MIRAADALDRFLHGHLRQPDDRRLGETALDTSASTSQSIGSTPIRMKL
jgi:hypothetical protein